MKKLLKKFLGGKKITSKNLELSEAIKFCENTEIDFYKFYNFFQSEQKRIRERNKNYEQNRIKKTIVFSKEDYLKILKKMERLEIKNFSNFANAILLNKKINTQIEQNYIIQLARIGNNLNQIAKYVNTQKDEVNKIELLKVIVSIEKELKNDNLIQ